MRVFLVMLLAVVALGAAGVWALGQFGHVFLGPQYAAREPLVIEPEIVAANDQAAAPAAATPNSAPTLQSQPAAPAPAPVAPPTAAAAPAPSAASPATTDAAPAPAEAAPAEPAPAEAQRRANPLRTEKLDSSGPSLRSIVPQEAPAQAAPPPPPPPPPPAPDPTVTAQSEPAYELASKPAPAASAQVAVAPAAAPAADGLQSQFKSRKVTYNRPPEKLVLNKAIDVSLVVNAADDADAGKNALQGFPGEVVERDVDLSNIVSAQLTGIGFDITTQTVERQKLSGSTINRWQWRVTPTELGTRTLILEIFGYESGSLDAEPLAAYRDEITVEVQQLDQIITWAKGVQPVFAVLAALAAALSAIIGFLRFRDERKKGKVSS